MTFPCSIRANRLLHITVNKCIMRQFSSEPAISGPQYELTNRIEFNKPEVHPLTQMYRLLDTHGSPLVDSVEINKSKILSVFRNMILLNVMDRIMYDSQRQGRISFYMTHFGEEAAVVASAAGLDNSDLVYGQYREAGVLLWRDFGLQGMMDQCYSNVGDVNKGRQMPVHYGSKSASFATISSPLSTQIPIAAGSAYALKLSKSKNLVACYFGEGAASEGDAFAGLNFAATLDCPIVFICRNNCFAISTPSCEQYRGDGVAVRGPALGIPSIRVDGNDALAMLTATEAARHLSITETRPVLIEAMCYRISHHSTSDDSTAYRSEEEINNWDRTNNPISRLRSYLVDHKKWITADEEKQLWIDSRQQVLDSFRLSEAKKKPNPLSMFTDVYNKMPARLRRQMIAAQTHIEHHADQYHLSNYDKCDSVNLD